MIKLYSTQYWNFKQRITDGLESQSTLEIIFENPAVNTSFDSRGKFTLSNLLPQCNKKLAKIKCSGITYLEMQWLLDETLTNIARFQVNELIEKKLGINDGAVEAFVLDIFTYVAPNETEPKDDGELYFVYWECL